MSENNTRSTLKRLQDIVESLDALLAAHSDEPEALRSIQKAYQAVDRLQALAPEEINTQYLRFLQSRDASEPGVPAQEGTLHEQGAAYFQRFRRRGDLRDLDRAITSWQRAVDLILEGQDGLPSRLNNLGLALINRFEHGGSLADLEGAISCNRKAALLTSDNNPDKPTILDNLGNALEARYDRRGSLADLEDAILQKQKAVHLTPNGHPYKPGYLGNLGSALQTRFERCGSPTDLEDAILQKQAAVDLTPDGNPDKPLFIGNLGNALLRRFGWYGLPADLEKAILHKRKAVELIPDDHPHRPGYLNGLGSALRARYDRHSSLADLEDAILQVRRAVQLVSDSYRYKPLYLSNLGSMLEARFDLCGSLADLGDAILQKQMAVDLTPDGHIHKPDYLSSLSNALQARFDRHGSLADLEDAILQKRKAVSLTPDGHPFKPMYLNNLGITLETRFHRNDSIADLEDAIIQMRMAIDLTPESHPDLPRYLSAFGSALQSRSDRNGSLIDLEDAVLQKRKALDLTPDGHPHKAIHLVNLGNISERKFRREGSPHDLADSILYRQRAIHLMPKGHPNSATCLNSLSRALRTRFELDGDREDLQGALSAAQESAGLRAVSSRVRLRGALLWAGCCAVGSMSSLPALDCAIKLLPRIAWLGLSVEDQYFLLGEVGSAARLAVAAAIAEDEYATAIEWAEQGRSIVWQNLLSLRTPLEELQSQHPDLALRLQELSERLEQPAETKAVSDRSEFSGIADSQMTVAMERDTLVEEIKNKPGFESFMKPRALDELAPAAQDGPVVFLNLTETRCDALILLSDDSCSPRLVHISLERVTLQNAEQLSRKLTVLLSKTGIRARDSRKHRVQGASDDDEDTIFKSILRTLWLDYVQPILEGLAYQINLESPPRLWWCTTGPLAFLPLHAAGLYDTLDVGHKVSDYVVSSYTPTLAALLAQSPPTSSEEFKILSVAISNTPNSPLPCTEEEVQKLQYLAANLPVVSLANEEATKERVLNELEGSTWAHLACHGEQTGGKPMESGLILHDGKLKLSEIVKSRLPNAEFAFLSACQTAVGDGGVPEESAHLAAGMLFAGYRGIVATMWSIQDDIAPRVAEEFYRHMFRNGKPVREEAAHALHKAVRSLQESKVPFTSWVPFIHVGR